MRAFLCDTRTWGRGSAPLERGHRPCRLSWDKKVVVTGFCHSRVPSKGGTEVHCHSGDSFLSVSLMLLLGSCIFTKIPALLDCGYIPTASPRSRRSRICLSLLTPSHCWLLKAQSQERSLATSLSLRRGAASLSQSARKEIPSRRCSIKFCFI